jgi:hypothetical protein
MKNFKPYELVPKATYEKMGDGSLTLFKPAFLIALDNVADFFSRYYGSHCPIFINDYFYGGQRQYCGWRPEECFDADGHPIGAGHSQHKDGNAADLHCKIYSAEQMREIVLAHKDDPLLEGITRLEAGVSWMHMDSMVLPAGIARIHLFKS